MFCTKCGFKFEEPDAKFCAGCGAAVETEAVSQSETPRMYDAPVPQMHQQTQPYATPPMYQQEQQYALQPTPKKKSKIWIPITAVAATFVLIFGALFLFDFSSLTNGYSDGEGEIVDDADRIIDGQPLIYYELDDFCLDELLSELGAGEVEKGEVMQIARQEPIRPIEPGEIEWIEFELLAIEDYGITLYTNFSDFENFGTDVTNTIIFYEVTNTHEYMYMVTIEYRVLVNGAPVITTSLYDEIPPSSTSYNFFTANFLYTRINRTTTSANSIRPGDTVSIILYVLMADRNEEGNWVFDDMGSTEFTFEVEEIDKPGISSYEWVDEHEDFTMTIATIRVQQEGHSEGMQSAFGIVLENPTNYVIRFGEIDFYINGEQVYGGDFYEEHRYLAPFFHLPPNSIGRTYKTIPYVVINYGDEVTIRGRLRVIYSNANVAMETVEFSFVL